MRYLRYFSLVLFLAVLISGCATAQVSYVPLPPSSEILVRNNSGANLKLYYGNSEIGAVPAGDTLIVIVPVSRPHCYYNDGYRNWGILQMETYGGSRYYCQPQGTYTVVGKINDGKKAHSTVKQFNFSTGIDYPVVEFSKWDFSQ